MAEIERRIIGVIPHNLKTDVWVFNDEMMRIGNLEGVDDDLIEVSKKVLRYFKQDVRKRFSPDCYAREEGILLKVPKEKHSEDQKYYLHIYGDNEWKNQPNLPIWLLREYVARKTNSPRFNFPEIAWRFGYYMGRSDLRIM